MSIDWDSELWFITHTDCDKPGPLFCDSPATFAQYVRRQARIAKRQGLEDTAAALRAHIGEGK